MDTSDELSPLDISACIAEKAEETLAPLKEDLVDWLNNLFDADLTVDNFMECLDNGVLVSQVAELVHHAAEKYYESGKTKHPVPRFLIRYHKKAKSGTFFARDNVAFFLEWCRGFGVSESVLFESDGLVMHKQPREVVLCLLEVARIASDYGIEPPGIINLEKEIDAEIASEGTHAPVDIAVEEIEKDTEILQEDEKIALKQMSNDHVESESLSLDKQVLQLARSHGVRIKKVKEGRYIVEGKITIFVRILRHHVMVRVGGGWDTLDNFLKRHDASKIGRILTCKC